MQRREFIGLLGGAVAWPVAARAQSKLPVIGLLYNGTQQSARSRVAALRRGLKETGYVEGENVTFEYRWSEGNEDRLPAMVADLIDRKVAVIYANSINAAQAAKAATGTIPIVFLSAGDPVEDGLVTRFNRPGGNATGIRLFNADIVAKRLQLLHDLVPTASSVGFLVRPSNPTSSLQKKGVQAAAAAIGLHVLVLEANEEQSFDQAFVTLAAQKVDALLVGTDSYFVTFREGLIRRAARDRPPVLYDFSVFAVSGGLISYGTNLDDANRLMGIYVGRILKGEKPSELPVMQPTKFELVINLGTAKALGLKVPPTLLAQADEVIE
jgi:putative ABC transport system substrate-binding protein